MTMKFLAMVSGSAILAAGGGYAVAQTQLGDDGGAVEQSQRVLDAVTVTAQKRAQDVNDVPMSIVAMSAEDLETRGFEDVDDLDKLVPGFTATATNSGSPVYSLRGVGLYLYDSGVGAAPAVSVYIDEVGLPSPAMTSGAAFDLERVEILKGPQGTLFGQNATGGAVNFIAAKPTDELSAGISSSFDQHGKIDAEAYLSGPLADTVQARLALGVTQGGAWQESVTRPGDELGDSDLSRGRLLIDWQASENLDFSFNATLARDKSDAKAGQFSEFHPAFGGDTHPNPVNQAALSSAVIVPDSPELADWTPGTNTNDNQFDFYSLRTNYALTDSVTLTSLTAYQEVEIVKKIDQDGVAFDNLTINPFGRAETLSQELRLSGATDRMDWVFGLNYEDSDVINSLFYDSDLSANYAFGPGFAYDRINSENTSSIETAAFFANLEYALTEQLSVQLGGRYTDSSIDSVSCTSGDDSAPGDPGLPDFVNFLASVLGPGSPGLVGGDCIMLEASAGPNAVPTGPIAQTLSEDNVSWRTALTYSLLNDTIIYANISRAYKSGAIIPAGGLTRASYTPTTQERITAYEAGFKAPLFDGTTQLNGSAFFYDYEDKQVPYLVYDPAFGVLPALGNVPKSEVQGIELQLVTRPLDGLDLSVAATYLDTEVTEDFLVPTGLSPTDVSNVKGVELPNTPDLSIVADSQYRWNVNSSMEMYVGAGLTYVGDAFSRFPQRSGGAPILPSYTLLDLRAGIGPVDGNWDIQIWGRNVTDEYYRTTDNNSVDTSYHYAGQGSNFGVTLNYAF